MKNLITLYSTKININGGLFVRHFRCRTNGKCSRNYAICSCPATLTPYLTSHNTSDKNTVAQFRKQDAKKRFYCSNSGPPSQNLPPLMHFPTIIWPSFIKSFRNFILSTFIIKPYFDADFNLPDFARGSKQALEVVSTKLSQGDFKSLDGLVTSEVSHSVQKSVSLMNVFQREQIATNACDIFFSFPYQVGIIFNETENDQRRFVEITMVFHVLRGFAAMKERGEDPPLNMAVLPEYQSRLSICNYRFIREYTKGAESDWTINLLNHFKHSEPVEK